MQRAIGERITQLRVQRHETQQELAAALGVSAGTPSRWERGIVLPNTLQVLALAQRYNISVEYLLLGGSPGEQLVRLPDFTDFLATPEGRLAHERGWLSAIGSIVARLPYTPTVQTYRALAMALQLGEPPAEDTAL